MVPVVGDTQLPQPVCRDAAGKLIVMIIASQAVIAFRRQIQPQRYWPWSTGQADSAGGTVCTTTTIVIPSSSDHLSTQ